MVVGPRDATSVVLEASERTRWLVVHAYPVPNDALGEPVGQVTVEKRSFVRLPACQRDRLALQQRLGRSLDDPYVVVGAVTYGDWRNTRLGAALYWAAAVAVTQRSTGAFLMAGDCDLDSTSRAARRLWRSHALSRLLSVSGYVAAVPTVPSPITFPIQLLLHSGLVAIPAETPMEPQATNPLLPGAPPQYVMGGAMSGSPSLWTYRGRRIEVGISPGGRWTATVVDPQSRARWNASGPDEHAALSRLRYWLDVEDDPALYPAIHLAQGAADELLGQRAKINRATLARAIEARRKDPHDLARAGIKAFDALPIARRLQIIDATIEYARAGASDPYLFTNPFGGPLPSISVLRDALGEDHELLDPSQLLKHTNELVPDTPLYYFRRSGTWAVLAPTETPEGARAVGRRLFSALRPRKSVPASAPLLHELPVHLPVYGSSWVRVDPPARRVATRSGPKLSEIKQAIIAKGNDAFGAKSIRITGKPGAYELHVRPTRKAVRDAFRGGTVSRPTLPELDAALDGAITKVQAWLAKPNPSADAQHSVFAKWKSLQAAQRATKKTFGDDARFFYFYPSESSWRRSIAMPEGAVVMDASPKIGRAVVQRGGARATLPDEGERLLSAKMKPGFLYHLTTSPAYFGIRDHGLQAGRFPGIGTEIDTGYEEHSRGGIFLTDAAGIEYWLANMQAKSGEKVLLRTRAPKCDVDEHGTRDAREYLRKKTTSYRCTSSIAPEDLEVWDVASKTWLPVPQVEMVTMNEVVSRPGAVRRNPGARRLRAEALSW